MQLKVTIMTSLGEPGEILFTKNRIHRVNVEVPKAKPNMQFVIYKPKDENWISDDEKDYYLTNAEFYVKWNTTSVVCASVPFKIVRCSLLKRLSYFGCTHF